MSAPSCTVGAFKGRMGFRKALLFALVSLSAGLLHAAGTPAPAATDADIKRAVDKAVMPFMERYGIPGMAVGIVTPNGSRVFNYGYADGDAKTPVTDETLFDAGSISKTFTATLASLAEVRGKLSLQDRIDGYLPELKGSAIGTAPLLQLGTQTSCLPFRAPDEIASESALMGYLSHWKPDCTPGATRIYSNVGIGLLGLATARALNADFQIAMREEILLPLGLRHTWLDLPASEAVHYAAGRNGENKPARMTPGLLWAEAYGIRTTASDLILYIKANLGMTEPSADLRYALANTHKGYFRSGPLTQALVWDEFPYSDRAGFIEGNSEKMVLGVNPAEKIPAPAIPEGDVIIGKTGATNGFGAYVAFIPAKKIGIVILANRTNPMDERVKVAYAIMEALGAESSPTKATASKL
jgi:beta-lactamase class C